MIKKHRDPKSKKLKSKKPTRGQDSQVRHPSLNAAPASTKRAFAPGRCGSSPGMMFRMPGVYCGILRKPTRTAWTSKVLKRMTQYSKNREYVASKGSTVLGVLEVQENPTVPTRSLQRSTTAYLICVASNSWALAWLGRWG